MNIYYLFFVQIKNVFKEMKKKKEQFVQDHSLMPELGVPFSMF